MTGANTNQRQATAQAANSLDDYVHPFEHCMTQVVPGMKDQPDDPEAFCAYLVHEQTGEWPGDGGGKQGANAKPRLATVAEAEAALKQWKTTAQAANQLSADDLRSRLQTAITADPRFQSQKADSAKTCNPSPWVRDVIVPDSDNGKWQLIVAIDDKFLRIGFSVANDKPVIDAGDPQQVQIVTSYQPVTA